MIKHLSKTILIFLLFFSTSYAENNSEINRNQYYKLQTSNIYFSSIKGRSFFFGIGFDEQTRNKYFPGKPHNDQIHGHFIIYSMDAHKSMQPIKLDLNSEYWSQIWKVKPIPNLFFISNNATLDKGEYILVPEIYVSKNIPEKDINHTIMVFEKTSWK